MILSAKPNQVTPVLGIHLKILKSMCRCENNDPYMPFMLFGRVDQQKSCTSTNTRDVKVPRSQVHGTEDKTFFISKRISFHIFVLQT